MERIKTYPLETAMALVKGWGENCKSFFNGGNELESITITRETLEAMLANESTTDVRVYLGLDNYNEVRCVAVGVKADGDEIFGTSNELIYNNITPTPPYKTWTGKLGKVSKNK